MAFTSLSEILTTTSPTVLAISTLPTLLISFLLHRAFLTPLSSIPGPVICRFTSLWIWYHSYLGDEASLITSLHAIYGPIIRIAPSEVVISDGAALNAIYSEKSGFRKADCYENFDFEGHATIFSARDGEYRARRSKAVAPLFSPSNVRARQKTIEACVQRFIQRMKSEAETGEPVDILNLSRSLALDAVSSLLFGRPYGGIEEKSDRLSASGFVDMLVFTGRFFFLPHWLFVAIGAVTSKLAPSVDPTAEAGGAGLESFAREIVRDTPAGDNTFQGRLKAIGVSDHEIEVQCMDLLFAGTDSTGTNLSKLIWRLAKSPRVYQRLREEVLQAESQNLTNPPTLPYINAVLRESLRIGMSTPTRLPRVVPASGWTFDNHYFPAGTIVGCQLHTLHFNPAVFPDPFEFKPERWLNDPSTEMQRDWIPFSLGARGCLARGLAMEELRIAVCEIVRQDVLRGARAVGDGIEMLEWFNSKLVGERLDIVWEQRK